MTTFRERLSEVTKDRLSEMVAEKRVMISAGGLPDHGEYRYHCGIIQGLNLAIEEMDKALADLQKG